MGCVQNYWYAQFPIFLKMYMLYYMQLIYCDCLGEMLDGECGEASNTPLHQAYYNKNYKIMFELVKAGADPSCTDDYVFSTLHYAALDNNLEAVQAVVEGAREGGEEAEGKLQEARETTDFNDFLPGMDTENEEIIKVNIRSTQAITCSSYFT